jgi:biotin carboxyl carrier protein
MKYEIQINGTKRAVEFDPHRRELAIDGRKFAADAANIAPGTFSILLDGRSFVVTVERNGDAWSVRTGQREFQVAISDPRSWKPGGAAGTEVAGRQQVMAPMPGKVVRVLAAAGQKVESGQGLLVIEAMKMQNEIRSPKSGTIERLAREGQTVNAGEVLAVVV